MADTQTLVALATAEPELGSVELDGRVVDEDINRAVGVALHGTVESHAPVARGGGNLVVYSRAYGGVHGGFLRDAHEQGGSADDDDKGEETFGGFGKAFYDTADEKESEKNRYRNIDIPVRRCNQAREHFDGAPSLYRKFYCSFKI